MFGEGGYGMYPIFNAITDHNPMGIPGKGDTHAESCNGGDPNGNFFVPHESDLSIQNRKCKALCRVLSSLLAQLLCPPHL